MLANPNALLPRVDASHIPPGSLLTVTIGRNVGNRPLWSHEWREFQSAVSDAVTDLLHPSASFGPFHGTGEWEGVSEDSAVFTFLTAYPAGVKAVDERLAQLADMYGQDAIAWSFGTARLATR